MLRLNRRRSFLPLVAAAFSFPGTVPTGHASQPQYASPSGNVPSAGASTVQMTFQYSGVSSSTVLDVLMNRDLDARNACYIAYSLPYQTLYLVGDDGSTLYPAPASNSQCSVSLASASLSGTNFALAISYIFKSAFATGAGVLGRGDKVIFGGASDSGGLWTSLGTWRVWAPPGPPSAPFLSSFETSGSSQAHQLLTARFNGSGANSPDPGQQRH
jgi:hypothetical protein